jgi:hypothetical protein
VIAQQTSLAFDRPPEKPFRRSGIPLRAQQEIDVFFLPAAR